jgi:uncharacterized protein YbjT (DUF2867 family)
MILITGATGTVGKELVKLLARPEEPIRVMVRDRTKAAAIAYPGANIVEGDLRLSDTLDKALSGVHKAFLLSPPDERQAEIEGNFVTAAARSNVKHIVKLSALGAAENSPARLLRGHAETERRIEESGIPYTFLRPCAFMQNFLAYRDSIIQRGEFYAPMGGGRVGIVDVRDVAAVAAEVLEEYGHENKVYDVTGPESLSYADAAARLTEALGKPVTYVDVPPEAARDSMLQSGMSPWFADALLELFALWKVNAASEIADTVQHVAKKDPITFAEFAHEYAPQFGRTSRDTLAELMDNVNLDTMTPGA